MTDHYICIDVNHSSGLRYHSSDSQANNYLATVTLKEGKVYAFFVKSPAKVGSVFFTNLLSAVARVHVPR